MCADRTLEGSRLADMGVAAVPADPHLLILTGKDRKAAPVILLNALLLGFLISVAERYLA